MTTSDGDGCNHGTGVPPLPRRARWGVLAEGLAGDHLNAWPKLFLHARKWGRHPSGGWRTRHVSERRPLLAAVAVEEVAPKLVGIEVAVPRLMPAGW